MTTHRGDGGNQGTCTTIPTGAESKEIDTLALPHSNFHQCSLPQSTQRAMQPASRREARNPSNEQNCLNQQEAQTL